MTTAKLFDQQADVGSCSIRTNHSLHLHRSSYGRLSCLLSVHGSVSTVPNYKAIGLRFEVGQFPTKPSFVHCLTMPRTGTVRALPSCV